MNPIRRIRASVVCRQNDRLLTIRAVDPISAGRFLFLPGGGIELGESPAEAAVRETREETGYAIAIIGEPEVLEYPYFWAGKLYACQTSFFRAKLINPLADPVEVGDDDDSIEGVEWVAVSEIATVFDYHDLIRDMVTRLM